MSELRRYCRSTNPEVVAAVDNYFKEREALHKKARAFAKRYGANDVLWFMAFECRFAGLQFLRSKPPKDEHLWTRTDRNGFRAPKRTKEAKELRIDWEKHFPKGAVKYEPWLRALGLKQGLGGHPGLAYIPAKDDRPAKVLILSKEPITVADTVEITASEYESEEKEA